MILYNGKVKKREQFAAIDDDVKSAMKWFSDKFLPVAKSFAEQYEPQKASAKKKRPLQTRRHFLGDDKNKQYNIET